jgi:hypothetical protein
MVHPGLELLQASFQIRLPLAEIGQVRSLVLELVRDGFLLVEDGVETRVDGAAECGHVAAHGVEVLPHRWIHVVQQSTEIRRVAAGLPNGGRWEKGDLLANLIPDVRVEVRSTSIISGSQVSGLQE